MRIVSWNCRQGFDAKANSLLALAPDIAVVPESHRTPGIALESLFDKSIPHLWTGTIPQKGLGLFAPGARKLDQLARASSSIGEHGIAGRAFHGDRETNVVGIWTVPLDADGDPYLAAAKGIVNGYATSLKSGNAILAGDFNVSGRTCLAGITAFAQEMRDRFGLVSAFHTYHGIRIGAEPEGTLWWRGDERAAFHCDFVFVPTIWEISRVEVGSYAVWGAGNASARSDHAPVIVDVVR